MSFGRKGLSADEADLAARRAAFLAEERSRRDRPAAPAAEPAEPVYVRQKTPGTAYLLWFVLGGLSAHRFYLGYSSSAYLQAVLTPIGYALLFSGAAPGIPLVTLAGLWLLADAFLIPDMVRAANAKLRDRAAPAFA